jgi:hypothetical protein
MNGAGAGEASPATIVDRVAGLVRAFVNSKPLTAVLKHLRHEWQLVQTSGFVEGGKDLLFASNFHPIARSKCHPMVLNVIAVMPIPLLMIPLVIRA